MTAPIIVGQVWADKQWPKRRITIGRPTIGRWAVTFSSGLTHTLDASFIHRFYALVSERAA